MGEKEIVIEKEHCKQVMKYGAVVLKGKQPNRAHWPDRLVLFDKYYYWIEFKTARGALSPGQHVQFKILVKAGHRVYVANTRTKSEAILNWEFLMAPINLNEVLYLPD